MRKGSTVFGSLISFPKGIKTIMLPLCAVPAFVTLMPVAARAAGLHECSRFPGWWQRASRSGPVAPAAPTVEAIPTVPAAAAAPAVMVDLPVVQAVTPVADAAPPRPKSGIPSASEVAKVIRTRATWYGPGFHGRRTASGERFDQNAMTLASRHLPFGTRLRVVNPRNGKSAFARVNDRGPFRSGYTADLSKGLAFRIGMMGSGPVRLEVLKKRK